ncbi:MAG: MOSC domain-containing protein [Pseudomonadota bacterium]
MSKSLQELFDTLPQIGRVDWIGVRPERKAPIINVNAVEAKAGRGLTGDRYNSHNGKRQITLIQAEHLFAIGSMLGKTTMDPALLRRNIVISGINLLALKDKQFILGNVLLEYTGLCQPCSAMEATLGAGGYNAVRGHGGITARILSDGIINVGDKLKLK